MYLHRAIERELAGYLRDFKVVLVTGPRQVGKTTMLQHTLGDAYEYVSLDDLDVLSRVRSDAGLFFRDHPLPLVLDEVQYAPELFVRIKHLVDQSEARGRVVLTASQTYSLMHGVRESLAGRVGVLQMGGLSLHEVSGSDRTRAFVPHVSEVPTVHSTSSGPAGARDPWPLIHHGCMPGLLDSSRDWRRFYASYVSTYVERDVRDVIQVRDSARFYDFMVACAARTAQLFNASDIASLIGVDVTTVKSWIAVLEASGLITMLRPMWSNPEKRLAKTPKLYFMDTGLVCYLAGWPDDVTARRGAQAGHIFETFVVSEVLKSYLNAGEDPRNVMFYRDARKREIDLVIRQGSTLHPVEVKVASNPTRDACVNFSALADLHGFTVGAGAVICQTDTPYSIEEGVRALSVWDI